MVMSRLKIPSFEELLKKYRQPKAPPVSASVTPQDIPILSGQGLTLPTGWKTQPDPVKGISFVSPAGNTFSNIKLSPEGKIADLSGAMVNGKPIKIPPLPPPEPISPVSATVTGTTPFKGELELPEAAKIEADTQARNQAIAEGKAFYPSLIRGGEVSVAGFSVEQLKPQKVEGEVSPEARFQERAGQIPGIVGWANRPTALLGLTPADIVGIGAIVTGGVQAIRSLTEFGRQPQVKVVSQVAKAAEKAGKPIDPQTVQDARDALRTAYNLQKMGASEAADEILTKFNEAYTRAIGGLGTTTEASTAVRQVIAKYEPFIPRGTQTGAMAFGGKAAPSNGDQIAKALGIKFDGIQKGTANIPDKLQFTDPQTGSTTYGNTLEEVKANIDNMRAKFESAKVPEGVPETIEHYKPVLEISPHQTPYLGTDGYLTNPNTVHNEKAREVIGKPDIGAYMSETGSIRLSGGRNDINIELMKPPTPEQIKSLRILVGDKNIIFDISGLNGRIIKSGTTDNFDKFVSDINSYFEPLFFQRKMPEVAPLHNALIQEGEQLVAKADPANPDVVAFKGFLEQAKVTTGAERTAALRGMEGLEEKVRASIPVPAEEVILYRGEPIGVRPTTEGAVPFTPDIAVAQGWAGREGRVVRITLKRGEFDKLPFQKLPDQIATYRVPQEIYERAVPLPEVGMAPSTSVQTGLPGIGKEAAQVQMFGEVSGKESRKVPLTQPPVKGTEIEGQARLFEPATKYDRTPPEQLAAPQITEYLKTKRAFVDALNKENPDIEFGTKTDVRIYPLSEYHQFLVKAENSEGEARNTAIAGMQFFEPKLKERLKLFNIKIPKSVVQEPVLYPSRVEVPQSREIFETQETIPPQIKEGEAEAFREAEAVSQEITEKAAIEAQVQREMLRADPVASYRFKMGGRNVGLDSLISIKEQTFPEYLTVKQARALNPEKSFAKYTVKGTKFYNKVPKDAALDQLTKEFNMTPDEIAARVMEIRAERRAIRQAPLTPASEPTQQEKVVATTFGEAKVFSEKQKEQLIRLIGEYLENPNTDTAWELTRELRRETRAGQAVRLNERTQELLAEGVATEAAMTQAKREIMTGELPKVTTDYFDDVTDTMRAVLFDKVYQVLKDEPFERLSTQDALTNALVGRPIPNIRPTPPPGGFKSRLWPQGASALDKLRYVFGNQPKLLAGIQKMAEEKKPLRDVVEGIFREVDSWQAPMPIDQESADYLRALATKPMGQPRLGEEANIPRVTDIRTPEEQRISGLRLLIDLASTASPNQAGYINLLLLEKDIPDILKLDYAKATNSIKNPGGQARELLIFDPTGKLGLNLQAEQMGLSQEQFADIQAIPERRSLATMLLDYRRKNLMSDEELLKRVKDIDWETISTDESLKLQRELWIAKGSPGPIRPEFMDKNVWDTFKEKWMPGFNFDEKKMIVKVLQEIGLAPIDIGNFLRANMSSVDFSFFRTGRMLGSGHPVAFYKALLSGWKATWSQKEADAHWRAITLDPDYELYERIRKDTGYDPFRVPAKEREAAFRKSEEFGFPIEERFIPRMGQKLPHIKMSGRGFETALNDLVWSVWKQQLAMARRYGMKVASGQIKLKPGEAWDITKEMTDHQRMLGDMAQRASLNINVGKLRVDFTPASPVFGGTLFAPRAKWARLIVGRHLFSANPRVRAEAWKDIGIWIASTAGLVLLGSMLGLWEIETDPVSGEFMGIRIGKVRIDPWEGHRQIVNLYSRLITGQTKSSITGKKTPTNVMDTLANFVRSSLNVLPGLLTDMKMGKTFTGEKTDITNMEQTARRVLPFSMSQIWETFQENWRLGLVTLPISVLGESISAYDTAESVSTEAIAKLGKVDIATREEKVQKAKEAGFTPARIAEIMADDKAYDMEALRSDLNKSTSKGVRASPIVADYWTFKEQDDKYAKMSTKEQELYLKDNPNYVTSRLFWGDNGLTTIPDLPTAEGLVARAEKYGFNLDVIPAFQKADKTFEIEGEEVKRQVDRIPADRNLWPGYFDYKNLPEDTTQTARNKYLNDNPDIEAFLVVNTGRPTISSLEAAQKAANSAVSLDQIVAFSLTDKGKERIPSDDTLWKAFFDYNDLPGTSYLNFTKEQVDAGLLPEKYQKEWETYHKLKTDTAKDIFRKGHKEVSKGDWRDDFRRANPEFDKWLQDNQDMKPLPPKKRVAARRGGITAPKAASIGGGIRGGLARPRGGKPSYPKFKKVRVSGGMNVGAPRAPRI